MERRTNTFLEAHPNGRTGTVGSGTLLLYTAAHIDGKKWDAAVGASAAASPFRNDNDDKNNIIVLATAVSVRACEDAPVLPPPLTD